MFHVKHYCFSLSLFFYSVAVENFFFSILIIQMANNHTIRRFGTNCDFYVTGFVYGVNRVPINFDFANLLLWTVKPNFSESPFAPGIYCVAEPCRANLIFAVAKVHIINYETAQNKGDKHYQSAEFSKPETEINREKQQNSCENFSPKIVSVKMDKSHL